MKNCRLLLLLLTLFLAACTSFHGLSVIYPEVGNPNHPGSVDSLQPTFKWKPADAAGVTYDLIVYEGIRVETGMEVKRMVGK